MYLSIKLFLVALALVLLVPSAVRATEQVNLLTQVEQQQLNDKLDALQYIEEQLLITDSGCRAFENLLELQDALVSNEVNPDDVRRMAALYRGDVVDSVNDIIDEHRSKLFAEVFAIFSER
jgi:hypothetical protein